MRPRRTIPIALLALTLAAGSLGADTGSDLWLHVRVDEGDGGAKIAVNLPFELVSTALPMIDRQQRIGSHAIHFDDGHLTWEELRELWSKVRSGPDMTFVTVEEADEKVRVWKEAGFVYVEVRDRGRNGEEEEIVDVRMPIAFVDALLSGRGDELDVEAAILTLAEAGDGELVTVRDDDDFVRVWVDREPEPAER